MIDEEKKKKQRRTPTEMTQRELDRFAVSVELETRRKILRELEIAIFMAISDLAAFSTRQTAEITRLSESLTQADGADAAST